MTDDLRKLVMSKQRGQAPLTKGQEDRIDCALNLYRLAASLVCFGNAAKDDRIRLVCTQGALAEAYDANILWLNELLREKYGRPEVSAEETLAAWKRLYEWLVTVGIRPPIVRWDGVKYVPLTFEDLHARIRAAHHDVRAFRREHSRK